MISTTSPALVRQSRRRPLLGLASAAVLTMTGLALPSAAHAADTAGADAAAQCPTAAPASSITPDEAVHGLTVSKGTTPEEFTGTVTGILDDGIQPGTDMIIMELHSTAIDKAGGIWEGMSGSPVYDADGRLIGAVAYGLASGPSPVAGITPYSAMQKYLPGGAAADSPLAAPKKVDVDSKKLQAKIADAAGVSTAQADQFRQLGTPSPGISAARQHDDATGAKGAKADHKFLGHFLSSGKTGGVAKAAAAPGPDTLVPGGNVGAAVVWGDVVEGGVGTVTAVCKGSLVAFGHPMAAVGKTAMALLTADTLYVQEDPYAPFKVANLGGIAGTINRDGFTGIAGPVGKLPATATFSASSSYDGGKAHSGKSYSSVADYYADGAFGETTAMNDAALDAVIPGGALVTYTVKGTAAGKAFTLTHTDRYASSYDISYDSSWDIGDLTYVLSQLSGVKVTSVTTSTKLDDHKQTTSVSRVEQYVGGKWVKVTRKSPVSVKAGKHAVVRFVITGAGGTRYAKTKVWAPYRLKGATGDMEATGGAELYSDIYSANTFAQAKKAVDGKVRNDAVRVHTTVRRKGVDPVNKTVKLGGLDHVVYGYVDVPFRIR